MKSMRLAVALLALAAALPAAAQQLQMIDLGYPAGPGFADYSQGFRLNERDQVAGNASNQDARCFLWDKWAMSDLGTLGGVRCTVSGINGTGQVAGASYSSSGSEHAFVWDALGGMRDLGVLYDHAAPLSTSAAAMAINDAGQVVGWGAAGPSGWSGLVWQTAPAVSGPVSVGVWQGYAMDVNASGQVVGYFNSYPGTSGYVWEDGALTVIAGLPNGEFTYVRAINDAGQVIGSTAPGGTTEYRGFLWQRDATGQATTIDLGGLGGTFTEPTAIAADGRVVGSSMTATGEYHVFVWEPGSGMRDLGTLGGGTSAGPSAVALVDGRLHVVGQGSTAAGAHHAFLWRDGDAALTDLGTLGGTFAEANDVNSAGHVVGRATTAGDLMHAVLWTTRSTPALLDDLVALAQSFALPKDYASRLTSAASYLAAGNTARACGDLGAFTNSVTKQSGKAVPVVQASQVTSGSRNIQRLLGCK